MSGFRVFATVILLIAALTLSAAVAARVFPMEEAASMPSMPVIPDGGAAAEMKADGPEKTAEKPAGKPAEKPRIVHKVLANYPDQAKKEGLSGKVVIELTVAPDGSVKHAAVVRSDHEIFEEPSLDAVRQWRFEPAGNGESRPDIVHEVTIQFRLK